MATVLVVLAMPALLSSACSRPDFTPDAPETAPRPCPRGSLETPVPEAYGGVLLDTHVHFAHPDIPANLSCSSPDLRVEAAALFAPMEPADLFTTEKAYRDAVGDAEGVFLPFLDLTVEAPDGLTPAAVAKVLGEVGLFFRGVGEIGFGTPPWRGVSLDGPPFPELFRFAGERDLFVMVHPTADQAPEVAHMARAHPSTKLLVHGAELRAELPDLLRAHDNLFFTLDTLALLEAPDGRAMQTGHEQAASFAAAFDEHWEAALARAFDRWLPVIQAAPDRVMWGTDVALRWQSEPQAYARLVAFSRAFIERLPEPMRLPYAAGNARRLLGFPTPPQPDA